MKNFKLVFGDSIYEAYKLYSEYSLYVGNNPEIVQKIGIRITESNNGLFGYTLSHHYKGSKQIGPYTSSNNYCFEDECAALRGAKSEIFSFYDENDVNAEWVPSEMYYLI